MDIEQLKILARKAEPGSDAYLRRNRKKLEKMDGLVLNLHNKIMAKTDCLSCGNCCRSLGPLITNKDIDNMAKALRMKASEVIDKYLKIDEDKDFVFKTMPCPFLMDNNHCFIYTNRPKACQDYPHTHRTKFYQLFNLTIKNAYTCSVAYEVIEELKKEEQKEAEKRKEKKQ